MSLSEFISKLTPSDIIQIFGIIASFLTAFVAIVISLVTIRQNSKMIEESSRAVISIYSQSINTGSPMMFIVIKNFGNSPAVIRKFDYDFDFTNCYKFRADRDYLKDFVGSSLAPGQARICCLDYKKIVLAGACRREGSMRGEQLFHDVLRGTPSRKVKAVFVSGYWLASRGVRGTARVAERLFRLF